MIDLLVTHKIEYYLCCECSEPVYAQSEGVPLTSYLKDFTVS